GHPGVEAAEKVVYPGVTEPDELRRGDRAHASGLAVEQDPGGPVRGQAVEVRGDLVEWDRRLRTREVAFERHVHVDDEEIRALRQRAVLRYRQGGVRAALHGNVSTRRMRSCARLSVRIRGGQGQS